MQINHLKNKPSIYLMNFFNYIFRWFRRDKMEKIIEQISNIKDDEVILEADIQLTKNFKLSEFACKDGTPVPKKYEKNALRGAEDLQVLRDYYNDNRAKDEEEITVTIISGFRTRKYNKKVRGARFSKHKKAKAEDIVVKNRTPNEVHATIILLIKSKKMSRGGLGLYDGFVHKDRRLLRARWDKRKRI